jgi:hypothetical protein
VRLAELQARFLAALADGVEDGAPRPDAELLATIRGDGDLGPRERLGIYAGMYGARLVDVLREDFPRTVAALGDERFEALARAYLVRHRSSQPSVRWVGRHFAGFLESTDDGAERPWLADLARLEWLRGEAFDAADAPPLTMEDLEAVPPAAWAALRFQPIPALRTLRSDWPVHEIWGAEQADRTTTASGRATVHLRIWRQGFAVFHAPMDPVEAEALSILRAIEPFAAICEVVAARLPSGDVARATGALLLRWLADGLLARNLA